MWGGLERVNEGAGCVTSSTVQRRLLTGDKGKIEAAKKEQERNGEGKKE